MNTLKQAYLDLPVKEKNLVQVALIAIVFFICYQFIYLALQEKINSLTKQHQYQQQLNQWFKDIQPRIKANQNTSTHISIEPSQLLTHTSQNLKQNIEPIPYKLSQIGSNTIELTMKEIAYTKFIAWFETFFSKTPGLIIKELNITSSGGIGLVNANLKFEAN